MEPREALRAGASDYLVKLDLTPESLGRSIRYAVERQSIQARVRETRKLTPTIAAAIRSLDVDELATFHEARRIEPGRFVVLTITNDGDLLSPKVLERSFEPFYSTKFLGRRLGLAAANGTARGHGGAMRLEARAQGGAVTTIALPALPQALRAIG